MGTYAVALTLEDYPPETKDFINNKPFSNVGLQFTVEISKNAGSCSKKPFFTSSSPADGACIPVEVGSTYVATLEVKHADLSEK